MVQSADQVTGALGNWLAARFSDTVLALHDDPLEDVKPVIRLRLSDLYIETTGHRLTPTAVLRLDYLISVEAADTLAEHRYLGEIAFALAENPVLPVANADPVVLRMERRASGPIGIALSTSLPRARSLPAASPVLHPPVIRIGEMRAIEGIVEGPDGRALAGAIVAVPSLQLRQTTGSDGRFRFDVPLDAGQSVRITANKQRFSKTATVDAGQPLTLQLSPES